MSKPTRPVYTEAGAIFFSGPWAKAEYFRDGTVELTYAAAPDKKEVLTPEEGRNFMNVIGDRRGRLDFRY